jgi:hypothetical protein
MFAIVAALHQASLSAGFWANGDPSGSQALYEPRKAPSPYQMVRRIIPEERDLPGRQ